MDTPFLINARKYSYATGDRVYLLADDPALVKALDELRASFGFVTLQKSSTRLLGFSKRADGGGGKGEGETGFTRALQRYPKKGTADHFVLELSQRGMAGAEGFSEFFTQFPTTWGCYPIGVHASGFTIYSHRFNLPRPFRSTIEPTFADVLL